MIRDAVTRGFSDANELRRSPAYAPLRERPDFQRIILGLEDSAPRNA
jgi:hypothetical protein